MHKLAGRRGPLRLGLALGVLALLGGIGCAGWPWAGASPSLAPSARPTLTPEPLVPTVTPDMASRGTSTGARAPSASSSPPAPSEAPDPVTTAVAATADAATPAGAATSDPIQPRSAELPLPRGRERFGVGVALGPISDYSIADAGPNIGWYLNWGVRVRPDRLGGAAFWQMVRVSWGVDIPPGLDADGGGALRDR